MKEKEHPSKRTVVPTSKSHLLLYNYHKNIFTHCIKQKDRLAFSSVFFQSINGINFSLKGMQHRTGVSRKAFPLRRNTHATAWSQTPSAGWDSSPTYSKHLWAPVLGDKMTLVKARATTNSQLSSSDLRSRRISPAGVGTAALVGQGYLSHSSLPE